MTSAAPRNARASCLPPAEPASHNLRVPALLSAGTLVGAAGAILTQLMTKTLNRSLFNVSFAGFGTVGLTHR